jgi:hypothetical protein
VATSEKGFSPLTLFINGPTFKGTGYILEFGGIETYLYLCLLIVAHCGFAFSFAALMTMVDASKRLPLEMKIND